MDITWEEPPAGAVRSGQKQTAYRLFAAELRESKDRWAVLPATPANDKSAQTLAQNIRRGITGGFTRGEYEVAVQGTKLWVRWTGPSDASTTTAAQPSTPSGDEDDDSDDLSASEVRTWAKRQGLEVNDRGRLSASIVSAYRRAHAEPKYGQEGALEGEGDDG